ncbi:hypothetical protein AWB71_06084 [Caballeronia peredens]|nr:hypothetical protein AWB71_06084 [Caballeronia peredens]
MKAQSVRPTIQTAPLPALQRAGALRPKLAVGPLDDAYEREADAVAAAVMAGDGAGPVATAAAPSGTLRRKCAACAAADEDTLRLKPGGSPTTTADAAVASLGRGAPLPASERTFFESRLGRNLGDVRIHAEAHAATALGAHAFALGRDVAFAPGQWRPGTAAGRGLLAHELVHVLQQDRGAARAVRRQAHPPAGRQTTCVDKACFEDTLDPATISTAGGTIEGQVSRLETVRDAPERLIHRGSIRVAFDPSGCELIVPHVVRFQQPPSGTWGLCQSPAEQSSPVPNISAERMTSLQNEFIPLLNARLNGWFEVHLEGTGCPRGCAGRNIPIRVRVGTSSSAKGVSRAPNSTVTPVNRPGRSYVSGEDIVLCMGDTDLDSTIPHEAVHFVLSHGDEYLEKESEAAKDPKGHYSPEREIEGDSSLAGSQLEHGRFSMLHERHFQFATAFLEGRYPGCRATLVPLSRPAVFPEFHATLGMGYARIGGLGGFYESLAAEFGIPLERIRRWQLTVGPRATWMPSLPSESASRGAFLLGVRLGVEYRSSPGQGGFRLGAFGELGHGWFNSSGQDGSGARYDLSAKSLYGEAGVGVGYRLGTGYPRVVVGAEAAAGAAMGTGTIGPSTPEIERDPALTRYLRAGFSLGIEL